MTRVFRFLVVLCGSLLLFGAAAPQKGKAPKSDPSWYGFSSYPKARELCREFVLGARGEEIHWVSFASHDEVDQVVAFYSRSETTKPEKDEDGAILFRHGEETILEVHSATSTRHFQCDQKPRAGEKTVIVVSRLVSRGRK